MPSLGTSGSDGVLCCGHRISGTHSPQSSQQEERQRPAPACLCLNRLPVVSTPRTLSQVSHKSPAASSSRKYMSLCACDLHISVLNQTTSDQSVVQNPRPLQGSTRCWESWDLTRWAWVSCFLLRVSVFVNDCSFQGSLALAWDHWH